MRTVTTNYIMYCNFLAGIITSLVLIDILLSVFCRFKVLPKSIRYVVPSQNGVSTFFDAHNDIMQCLLLSDKVLLEILTLSTA